MNKTNYKTRFCDHCGMPLALHNRECQAAPAADVGGADVLPTYTFGDGHVYYRKNDIGALCTPSPGTGTTASAAGTIDTPQFREYVRKCATTWDTYEFGTHEKDLIAHITQWGAALAEEARREAEQRALEIMDGRERYWQNKNREWEESLAAAQRTAGGDDFEAAYREAYHLAPDADILDHMPHCDTALAWWNRGRESVGPVAEAAAQADDADWMGKIPHAFSNLSAAPTAQPTPQERKCDLRLCLRADEHAAGCTTYDPARYPETRMAAQPTLPDDERAAFEAWHRSKFATKHSTGQPTRDMHNGVYAEQYGPAGQQHMWEAFCAGHRAALRQPGAPPDEAEHHDYADALAILANCKRFLEDMHCMKIGWTIAESQRLHAQVAVFLSSRALAAKQAGKEA